MSEGRVTRKPLNPIDIEFAILDVCDALEAETDQYAGLSELAAETEAEYKLTYARAHVQLASNYTTKMTVHERQARADLASNDALKVWKIAEARRMASKEGLLSLRARMDALRTLSASLRNQT